MQLYTDALDQVSEKTSIVNSCCENTMLQAVGSPATVPVTYAFKWLHHPEVGNALGCCRVPHDYG